MYFSYKCRSVKSFEDNHMKYTTFQERLIDVLVSLVSSKIPRCLVNGFIPLPPWQRSRDGVRRRPCSLVHRRGMTSRNFIVAASHTTSITNLILESLEAKPPRAYKENEVSVLRSDFMDTDLETLLLLNVVIEAAQPAIVILFEFLVARR